MSEHNALGYWSGLALCLTKVRSSRACCPVTALINYVPLKIKLENLVCKISQKVFELEPLH